MNESQPTFLAVTLKTIVVHTVSYFVMGLLALLFLDYSSKLATPPLSFFMRQIDDPLVAAGPLFQPIRGFLFALVFYPLRKVLFGKKNGWLLMWLILVVVGVFSTFGPSPGSIEGMLYTTLPAFLQLMGLPEVLLQALLFSFVLFYWVNRPGMTWLNWILGVLFSLVLLCSILGVLVN